MPDDSPKLFHPGQTATPEWAHLAINPRLGRSKNSKTKISGGLCQMNSISRKQKLQLPMEKGAFRKETQMPLSLLSLISLIQCNQTSDPSIYCSDSSVPKSNEQRSITHMSKNTLQQNAINSPGSKLVQNIRDRRIVAESSTE
ncbi:hypothetical protein VTN00DRAFT_380 [Thermoascus crustaceus]|uniref:uncharacterized protein n=1 Tax=Thermoascus crustaceus TaxID=5088 RepID=UPI003742F226